MQKSDWMSLINKEKLALFLKNKLSMTFTDLEKRFDIDYGTYFAVYTDELSNGILLLGNYGIINAKSVDGKVKLVDNFDFLDKNQIFMMEFISFVYNETKTSGKAIKINNKNYIRDFNEKYNDFLNKNNKVGDNECE